MLCKRLKSLARRLAHRDGFRTSVHCWQQQVLRERTQESASHPLRLAWSHLSSLSRKWSFFGQKSTFSKSVQIDPKVSYMIRKCLRVCNSVILSSIGGLLLCFLKVCKNPKFLTHFHVGKLCPEVQKANLHWWLCHRCLEPCRRVLRTLSGWPEATWAARATSGENDRVTPQVVN